MFDGVADGLAEAFGIAIVNTTILNIIYYMAAEVVQAVVFFND